MNINACNRFCNILFIPRHQPVKSYGGGLPPQVLPKLKTIKILIST